ncbi:hypothetical protein V6B95_05650 [Thermoanaerobacterium saccharolyticum]|uniref:hypothetical protein n=1 Tax=Thermoanaerobacterium saccharolyticum TaxID=28896 RepID=UPI0005EFC768
MKKILIILLATVIIVSAISIPTILKGCAGKNTTDVPNGTYGNNVAENSNIKTNNEGSISIDVMFINPNKQGDKILKFQVMLNNHSMDLSDLNLSKSVELVNDKGLSIKDGFSWKEEGSGHHVSGILSVENNINGKKILDNSTKSIKLVIKNIGGANTREFVWQSNELK